MTPRALLTAIGATAIAFAIVIGTAAGSVSNQTTSVIASTTSTHMSVPAPSEVAQFTMLPNQDCRIAV